MTLVFESIQELSESKIKVVIMIIIRMRMRTRILIDHLH